ncbi:MAG TPA: OsmC family protein [Fulvivirga sp.]|nr:OsmC family protein [Fulvivirga sp.]
MSKTISFSVNSKSESPARTNINVRGFNLIVDEPISLGGTDLAPNPVEYILAGYAGCINVVAHIVAKEQKINLKNLEIDILGNLNPSRLFGTSFSDRAGYKDLQVTLRTSTKLDEGQKIKWLKEIESRCPVNDNLSNVTPITFSLN